MIEAFKSDEAFAQWLVRHYGDRQIFIITGNVLYFQFNIKGVMQYVAVKNLDQILTVMNGLGLTPNNIREYRFIIFSKDEIAYYRRADQRYLLTFEEFIKERKEVK